MTGGGGEGRLATVCFLHSRRVASQVVNPTLLNFGATRGLGLDNQSFSTSGLPPGNMFSTRHSSEPSDGFEVGEVVLGVWAVVGEAADIDSRGFEVNKGYLVLGVVVRIRTL